jgi:predicted transglutaminase-like cysteine proteinase
MLGEQKQNIYSSIVGLGLAVAAIVNSAGAAPKPYQHDIRVDSHKLVESHDAGAHLKPDARRPLVVSAMLGLFPGPAARNRAAPVAAAYALNGLRDSHVVSRLRASEIDAGQPHRGATLFRAVGIPFGKLPALERMVPVEADMAAGFLGNCATVRCERSASQLRAIIGTEAPRGFRHLVEAVNVRVNRLIRYQPDRATYGRLDFWANPSTTLNRGAGDCEDYAILKMAVLADAGIPRSAMSIVVLKDQRRDVYHAVLSIRTTQGNFILDNVGQEVLSDTHLPDYMPLYSVSNGRGRIYGQPIGESRLVASLGSLDGIAPGEGQHSETGLEPSFGQDAGPR